MQVGLKLVAEGRSGLLHEFSLEHERALVGFAVHFVVACALGQAYAFDFGAFLQHDRRAFDLQILDQNHAVTVSQHVAIGVLDHALAVASRIGCSRLRPLKAAVRANIVVAIGVGVFQGALGAGR